MGQTPAESQTATIAFLMSPETYGRGVKSVVRIDTHCAAVFLAGERAYKLKRAIKLPYLDYSTIALRRHYCEREVEINRHISPFLYLGVVPVTRDAATGAMTIDGDGDVVDWLVLMKRFDNDLLFDRMATAGRLTPPLMAAVAAKISQFHAKATVAPAARWVASFEKVIDDLNATLCGAEAVNTGLDFRMCVAMLHDTLGASAELMNERQRAGYVRQCHGDLHLNNIVLADNQPVLFDAIEFDEQLTTIDVLYDLAFLIMDLWHRDMQREANIVFNSYFLRDVPPEEWAGLSLLPLFLSVRASVRAMVGVHGLPYTTSPDARKAAVDGLRAYAKLAAELLTRPRPQLVVVGGLSGTGKTTLARAIAPCVGAVPGAIHLRSDIERKLMHGVDPLHHLPSEVYTPESRDEVYARVISRAEHVLRAGQSVVLDAVFFNAVWRKQAQDLADRTGAAFTGLWLEAEPVQMMARVAHRTGDASDADPQVVAEQILTATTPANWRKIGTRGTLKQTINAAMAALADCP